MRRLLPDYPVITREGYWQTKLDEPSGAKLYSCVLRYAYVHDPELTNPQDAVCKVIQQFFKRSRELSQQPAAFICKKGVDSRGKHIVQLQINKEQLLCVHAHSIIKKRNRRLHNQEEERGIITITQISGAICAFTYQGLIESNKERYSLRKRARL